MKYPFLWDESIPPGIDHTNEAIVADFDKRHSQMGDPVQGALRNLSELSVDGDSYLLDIGSGTGTFAIEAAKVCKHIYAVDVSDEMLHYSKQKAERADISNISFVKGGFLSYSHKGPQLDAVYTRAALHHLPDFWKQIALQKINSILKPGGKLIIEDAIFSFDTKEYQECFEKEMDFMKQKVDPVFFGQMLHDYSHEFMTSDWILEGILGRSGFKIAKADKPLTIFARYICIKN